MIGCLESVISDWLLRNSSGQVIGCWETVMISDWAFGNRDILSSEQSQESAQKVSRFVSRLLFERV